MTARNVNSLIRYTGTTTTRKPTKSQPNNIKAAGVSKDVTLKLQPFQQFEQPKEKAVIITNPPYGERISTNDLLGLYSMIGERLKHAFTGNTAWILLIVKNASIKSD